MTVEAPKLDRELLRAPYPFFGGKRRVAEIVWPRFGDCPNYVEPFAGSLAMLIARPHYPFSGRIHAETANDADGAVVNFWRAIKRAPEKTAVFADNPVFELDLHARHQWVHKRLLSVDGLTAAEIVNARERGMLPFARWLEKEMDNYDCRLAGWWGWILSSWIGDNACRPGVQHALPRLGSAGVGVNRHLDKQLPHLGNAGVGVNRHLDADGSCADHQAAIIRWFQALADRFRHVDVTCGDWQRVLGFTPTEKRAAPCAVFLDPPYSQDHGCDTVYGDLHDPDVAAKCRAWCIERGQNKNLRICLCGYDTEHAELHEQHGWSVVEWKAAGGYGSQRKNGTNDNAKRERLWFSPHCLPAKPVPTLFGGGHEKRT